ncbi:hypothetical protein PV08_08077 [Exophiala spinifera]|uniref:Trafficking protein particle complex subunit 11 domain-containing protein n=1 Tax=Exophiala spinifera TaxID=91928 RepID=A0A0D2B2P9_9EURO|nr:uncharacterized protein PV08_08077 [Exophiala spinifera]KIW12890.1 hypothetical protein PV08_08077 [Exophiala spinifera]
MDGSDSPASSKVIIQCIDPHNLYDSLEPRLSQRSPLRNLHWKSPTRPLRSIPALNITLSREDQSAGTASNVRRHQIPGLRETPYVKLYLLRCDDRETYKEKARKEVRQWVKSQISAADGKSNKNQEDHDAFEWLIVHVVLANTPAASQPRSSKHISLETTESTDSVNSKSKWSGKSSSTIFDRLRADFNSGSKSPINRVAQVRLLNSHDKGTPLSPADLEEQWQELIDSIKACILRSFDARVAQYESDIREKDGQRSLPGWNFCTFFILKEGLAKGFESVGLLEDALAVYDELSLGLDNLVKEQFRTGDNEDSGALLTVSKESKALLRAALEVEDSSSSNDISKQMLDLQDILTVDREQFPFDAERKNYQSLILTNDVSALDLRIYLFARQMELLLRQARAEASDNTPGSKSSVNLNILADLAERANEFINLAARSLRMELYGAWGGHEGLSADELFTQRAVTGNIVSTFEWRAVMQIMSKVLPSLELDVEYGTGWLSLDSVELFRIMDKSSTHIQEARNRSKRMSLAVDSRSPSRERSQGPHHKRISVIPEEATTRQVVFSRPGAERLAVWISRLVIMARRAVSNLEAVQPWLVEMKRAALHYDLNINKNMTNGMARRSSIFKAEDQKQATDKSASMAGLDSNTLTAAASSKSTFLELFAMLSVLAYRVVADTSSHSTAQQVLIDLVELEYAQGNYGRTARYLHSILGPLPKTTYKPSDGHLLRIYADCLRHLDKPTEYARCLIAYLHCGLYGGSTGKPSATQAASYVDQLFQTLPKIDVTTLPMSTLFMIPRVSKAITHVASQDGFALRISLQPLSPMTVPLISEVKLRLSSQAIEPRFISLTLSESAAIEEVGTELFLSTTVMAQGWYMPSELEVNIGKLRLLHHFRSTQHDEGFPVEDSPLEQAVVVPVLVYPGEQSMNVDIVHAPVVHLAETRKLLVNLMPGHNSVSQCRLRLKTATAGLRLNIHEAKAHGKGQTLQSLRTAREGDALMMFIDDLKPYSKSSVEIPYSLETQTEPSVVIRVEANYQTNKGTFELYDTASVNVILPVTVNVQDIFRDTCMYSRFTISPSTLVPLRLVRCELERNQAYHSVNSGDFDQPEMVFPKQPASWTTRLVPSTPTAIGVTQKLTLCVDFQAVDELILSSLEDNFISELSKTRHHGTARLLAGHLRNRVRTSWTEQDLEVAALTEEVEIWSMEDMDWQSVLCALDSQTRREVELWLQDWHAQTKPIKLLVDKAQTRQLKLYVDIAPHPLLITACLDIHCAKPESPTAIVGQPMLADLVMRLSNAREDEVTAQFEVSNSDSWLVGGRRKGHMQLSSKASRTRVVLVPQHIGHALLPTITVKCRKQKKGSGGEEVWTEVVSDVHNPMHGRCIEIIPSIRSTTVEVFGDTPTDGSGRLLSSR